MRVVADATAIGDASVTTLTAIAPSPRRGGWCSSPRSVMTTYAAINRIFAGRALTRLTGVPSVSPQSLDRMVEEAALVKP